MNSDLVRLGYPNFILVSILSHDKTIVNGFSLDFVKLRTAV